MTGEQIITHGLQGLTVEQTILHNLQNRKRNSLEKAIKIYNPYVRTVVYRIIGGVLTNEDIEEVISDVFISLWRHAENLDPERGNIRSYLGTIARNCAKNKLRGVVPLSELDETIESLEKSPQESIEIREEKDLLMSLIMELGEPDSEIFIRYYYYEEKIKNIAHYLELPISTIKTKLSRGRSKLKITITERGYGYE